MNEENNTERKFHDYGVGVYADDKERVAKVTAFIQDTFEGCEDGSYTIREKAPVQDGNPRAICTFGMALQAMKCGKGARRPGGEIIRLKNNGVCPPHFYREDGIVAIELVYDMLQEDWEIVD